MPDNGVIKVRLVAVDNLFQKSIQSFIRSVQKEDKRIFMTSATICSHDYTKYLLPETAAKDVLFGKGGDPMDTNRRMLILADSKKYNSVGKNSRYKKSTEILARIIKILDVFGNENCTIIAMSIKEAISIAEQLATCGHSHNVTYYKAPDTIGVASDRRVIIAVGVAEKPSNAFDAIRNTREESIILREEAIHSDTWQAWSRCKDPAGKINSVVFGLGCTEEQCKNISTWGFGRTVEIIEGGRGQRKVVNVKCRVQNISKPVVTKCKNFEEMLKLAAIHRKIETVNEEKPPEIPFIYKVRQFKRYRIIINEKIDLLRRLVGRSDAYGEQAVDGTYFKMSVEVNDTLLTNHIAGKITIGAYTLDKDSNVRWLCFDIDAHRPEEIETAERNLDLFKDVLKTADIPYIHEASGSPHSYHIWILLKDVEAAKAKEFGKDILAECNKLLFEKIKKMDISEAEKKELKKNKVKCEIYPKQTLISRGGYGNLVKLPFATHRKKHTKSEVLSDLSEVYELDISSYEIPIKETKGEPVMKFDGDGIRPFIKWSLTQQLEGSEGHFLRIAAVREYWNAGMKDVEQLARLFVNQADYDFEYSIEKIKSIVSKEMKNVRTDTLIANCPTFYEKFISGDDT
jgi:hypothetical protein